MNEMDKWMTMQFVGGPLDGEGRVHPAMNFMLRLESNPEGVYLLCADDQLAGTYYQWVPHENDNHTAA
jgi:hypothetical protein